jgi:hypothetical protein
MKARNRILAGALCLLAGLCGQAASAANDDVAAIGDALIDWAATDFTTNGGPPEAVRHVHLRYAADESGGGRHVLCGEFRAVGADDTGWTSFATVHTDPYEQWLGGQGAAYCALATPLADGEDLTAQLQARLEPTTAATHPP